MHTYVKRHVVWTWIAALAILFGAMAPAISRAMAADASRAASIDPAMEVCTMLGMKTVLAADSADHGNRGGKPDPATTDHMLEHCPYCAVHAAPALLPAPAPILSALPAAAAAYPPLFYRSAAKPFAWSPASPRGPPAPL